MMVTNSEKHNLVFNRVFEAPIEQVWKVWSEPEYVKQWWGPRGFTAPLARMDFRPGGTSLVCMSSPQFGDQYSTWHYRNIVPMECIEFILNLSDQDGNEIDPATIGMPADFPRDMRNTVSFKAIDENRTEITVTEYDWTPGQMMELSRLGMEQCLDKMKELLSSINGKIE
jgi:uncharacterized protein YndB with AHSA1/START domain